MRVALLALCAAAAAGAPAKRHAVDVNRMLRMQIPVHFDAAAQTLKLCAVNLGAAKKYPNIMPFFQDAVKHSGCEGLVHGETDGTSLAQRTSSITLAVSPLMASQLTKSIRLSKRLHVASSAPSRAASFVRAN